MAAKREFAADGLDLNFFCDSWYLGAYLGLWEELETWLIPKVEA